VVYVVPFGNLILWNFEDFHSVFVGKMLERLEDIDVEVCEGFELKIL
jgi:hypothetical protein